MKKHLIFFMYSLETPYLFLENPYFPDYCFYLSPLFLFANAPNLRVFNVSRSSEALLLDLLIYH